MPSKRLTKPRVRSQVGTARVTKPLDPETGRAIGQLVDSVRELDGRAGDRSVVVADLVVGLNRINHRLGRPPDGFCVTRTVASAAYSDALIERDARQVVIEVIGTDQPGARIEFYAAPKRVGRAASGGGSGGGLEPEVP